MKKINHLNLKSDSLKRIRLTIKEREVLYRAVIGKLRGEWKYRGDSILYTILGFMTNYQRWQKLKNIPRKDWEYVEQTIEFRQEYEKSRRQLIEMKRRNWVERKKTGDGFILVLTNAGLLRATKRVILTEIRELPDGQVVFVCYDIPEDQKQARQTFRYFLRQAKFKLLQKSVWYSTKDVVGPLKKLVAATKVGRWITIVVGRTI